jgi:hypothetical protein
VTSFKTNDTTLPGWSARARAAGGPVVSNLESRRWLPAVIFATMAVIGWVWQLFCAGARKPKKEPPKEAASAD